MDDLLDDRFDQIQEEARNERWHIFPISIREPRQLWARSNPLTEYNDAEFKAHFRFTKVNFLAVVDLLFTDDEQDIEDRRGNPLTLIQQLALTIAFYASDAFLRIFGQMIGVKVACA